MHLSRWILAAPLVVVLARPAVAQPARSDSAAAVATVEQFHRALATMDSAAAVSLLADDVMVLEAGSIESRADYLGHHLGADMKASQASKGARSLVKASVVGDAAYVIARTVTPPPGAEEGPRSETVELMVLAKTSSGWKIRSVHWSSRRRRA